MKPLADIVGANGTVAISASSGAYSSIVFSVTGSGTVRIGGASGSADAATSSKGLPIAAGGAFSLPWRGANNYYQTGSFSAYIPTGATLSVVGVF
jgi:hypothetical protein